MSEKQFAYKPKPTRVVIENVIAFIVILLVLEMLNGFKAALGDITITSLVVLGVMFLHNTYLLKPAIQNQQWGKYIMKLLVCLLVVFPGLFTVVEYIQHAFSHQPLKNLTWPQYYATAIVANVFFVLTGSSTYLVKYFAIERQLRLQTELLLKNQQLLLLQSQFNPHFLFNALNSIKALTNSNPGKARDAIVLLSELLRKSLTINTNSFIQITEELVTVKEYLLMEQLRYGNRLNYEVNMDADVKNYSIPAMTLQLLIENAIKHGINKLMDGGTIRIDIFSKDQWVYVEVRNPGQLDPEKKEKGLGTQNITEQIKLLYTNTASFTLINESPETVLAQLIIPINKISHD